MTTYSVHELGELIGLQPSTIFRYQRAGVLHRPTVRNRYDDSHVERGRLVQDLVRRMFTLENVRKHLKKSERQKGVEGGAKFQAWQRAELVPGLELLMVADASPLVRRLAGEVVRQFSLSMREAK